MLSQIVSSMYLECVNILDVTLVALNDKIQKTSVFTTTEAYFLSWDSPVQVWCFGGRPCTQGFQEHKFLPS